ncbi:MAG: TrkH family potassium uptake protein [Bacillus sp. (in: Bacteria)]|nr:TrkH family potassium uptake protein [Bacillus sp. (in: firmicutes)]MCM1428021.1 TrkH family potassium uptake protein [Eubacterium sp.]
MNFSIIRYILFRVLEFTAVFLTLPCLVAVIYKEKAGFAFAAVMIGCFLVAEIGKQWKPKSNVFYAREGFVTVSLTWIILSLVGALPFYFSREIPSFVDALYETISGLTTTGASILSDVEPLSKCVQFWRLFTHWIGGMGVLVLIIAVLPLSGGYNMHLMRAESPGPTVGKLVPRVQTTAKILYGIYIGITLLQIILLKAAGMSLYDSIVLSFSTMGTGGFGVLNTSIGSYTIPVQVIFIVFMILGGMNFNVYYLLLVARKPKDAIKHEEARMYLFILFGAAAFITWNIRGYYDSIAIAFKDALFQVASLGSSTGFSTTDFDLWPEFSKAILIVVMTIGACAGSTGGGFKVSRVMILIQDMRKELIRVVHPQIVKKPHLEGRAVDDETATSIHSYLIIYLVIFLVSFLLLSMDKYDFTTNVSAVLANLNNTGPGFHAVGPTCNYGEYSIFSKLVLMFDMLTGRLELLPMLILFAPRTWKKY